MRTSILIVAAVVVLCLSWFLWSTYNKKGATDPWTVISSKAVVVVESENFDSLIEKMKENADLAGIPSLKKNLSLLPITFFNKKEILLSLYLNSSSIEWLCVISNQKKKVGIDLGKKIQVKARNFSGYEIHDLYDDKNNALSYAEIDDLMIIGASFLVEDAIRVFMANDNNALFKDKYSPLFTLKTLKTDDGNVYVNLPALLNVVSKEKSKQPLLNRVASAMLTDLKVDKNQIFLNGFTVDSLKESTLFSSLKGQQPGVFAMKEVISIRSNFIAHYSLSDNSKWIEKRSQFIGDNFPSVKAGITNIENALGKKLDVLQKAIGEEVAVSNVETSDGSISSVVICKVKDSGIDNYFRKTQVGEEIYSTYTIREIKDSTLVKSILWPMVTHDKFRFYSKLGEYALFTQDVKSLKEFLADYDSENTLGKSLEWNKFLSTSMQESSVDLFFTGSGVQQVVDEYGLTFFQSFKFEAIDKAAIQFSNLDQNFYTNAIISLVESSNSNKVTSKASYQKFNSVIKKAVPVINHTDKTSELFLQDSLHTIYLTSSQNQLLWNLDLPEEIIGDVTQVDYYKNRKLQYFFATKGKLNLIDRLGRNVTGFPKQLKFDQDEVIFSHVIDYDNTRNYRFLIATKKGNIYIYDQNGVALEGWSPKVISGTIKEANHYRIGGKDYILVAQENGAIHLYQRSGEEVKNFPVRLNEKISDCFVVLGKDQSSNYFSAINEEGVLTQIDLTGKTKTKEPLIKNYAQSRFSVLTSDRNDQHLISRVDKTKIALFDRNGKLLFEKENPASEQLQFKLFSGKKSVLSAFDSSQDLLFLFDSNGKDITAQPIEASQSPVIEFISRDKIKMYYINRNELHFITLPI